MQNHALNEFGGPKITHARPCIVASHVLFIRCIVGSSVHSTGRASYEWVTRHRCNQPVAGFAKKIYFKVTTDNNHRKKMNAECITGCFARIDGRTTGFLVPKFEEEMRKARIHVEFCCSLYRYIPATTRQCQDGQAARCVESTRDRPEASIRKVASSEFMTLGTTWQ